MAAFWNDDRRAAAASEAPCNGTRRSGLRAIGAALLAGAVAACAPPSPPAAAPEAPAASDEAPGSEEWGSSAPATADPSATDPPPNEPDDSERSSGSASSSTDDGLDADIAELSASTQAPAATARPPSGGTKPPSPAEPATGREIVYRVTPKGLLIEVDGIHLRPEAKPFKSSSGAYGIQLVVHAESFDGRQYWVSKPKEGPLSIAGKIEGQGKSSRFGDQREGSGEEPVLDGSPRRFEQRWPGRGQPKLWAGQTVTLEVGLWGVRAESERERPVRRLFVVKMLAGARSQAIITPPTMDWGT